MSEDAPVNTDAVRWPDPDSAYFAVRRMQTKLHRWATEEPARRFDDLYNLVYDPAFLMAAWERVATNKGAKTRRDRPGHRGPDRDLDRGRGFPGPYPGRPEIKRIPAGRSPTGDDTEVERKAPQTRYPHRGGSRGPGQPEAGARTHL